MPGKGTVQLNTKWGEIVSRFVDLDVKSSFLVFGDQRYANNLRSLLNTSSRTSKWRLTVKRAGENQWRVTKVEYWTY